jgi:hypothetical protein
MPAHSDDGFRRRILASYSALISPHFAQADFRIKNHHVADAHVTALFNVSPLINVLYLQYLMPSLHLSRIKITAPLCIIFPLFT